ncbi:MAG: glutamate 5-kinase [Legionella longbeachae]|nr:glutamate 5-kinase [Legionella longbeachae]
MKIVIKVGTQSILKSNGMPIDHILLDLVLQIATLQKSGHHVILVSSGAVGSGRKVARNYLEKEQRNSVGEKQLLASLGQHELMSIYAGLFKTHNILVSQILLTKQDFQTRQHYLNITRLLNELLKHKNIIPIINENDSVAIEELMFTDNDELAGLIAAQINADKLIILTNVNGVFTGHPSEPDSQLIKLIDPNQNWPNVSSAKSELGRGGMLSKLNTARKMSSLGISTTITNINEPDVLAQVVAQKELGTTVITHKKKSNIKRWIAYNSDKKMGSISINQNLSTLLKENTRIVSLLPVGIEKCMGEFKKGDLIEIINHENQKIGVGIARYDYKKLHEYLGEKNRPAFIHYDHLHLF